MLSHSVNSRKYNMLTVDAFNEDGSFIGARLDCPDEWCDFYEKTPSYEILRAQLKIANRGLDVIDAIPLPLCCAMGKTDNEDQAVGVVNFDLTEPEPWVDHMEYTKEEKDWLDDLNIDIIPKGSNCMFPTGSLKHGTKTSFSDISPETEMFDNTPLATPIKSAIKYATICKACNVDPSDYLRQVEKWWDLDEGALNMINVPEIVDLSFPRVAGSSAKNSSPIYGMDNLAGRITLEHTGLTRDSFLTDMEANSGYFSVSDFGRFNAFMRYVIGLSIAIPGLSRDSIMGKAGRVGFAVSPNYAFKYKKEDFILNIPKVDLPLVKAGKAARPIIDYLNSDQYIRHLIHIYSKIDMDEDYNFFGVDVKKYVYDLKKRITTKEPKPFIMQYDDLLPQIHIEPKYIPTINVKKDFSSTVIDNIGTAKISDPVVAGAVGSFINLISDSKVEYTEIDERRIMICNALNLMFTEGARIAVRKVVSTQYKDGLMLSKSLGVDALSNRDVFENILNCALSVNYKGVVIKVYKFKEGLATIYVDEMDKGKVHPDAVEVKGIGDALKAWAMYYSGKSFKLTDKDTNIDHQKVVMYSSLSRIFTHASFNVKSRKLTWPNIADEIQRKGINYAKKLRKKFTFDGDPNSWKDLGDSLDKQLEPIVSFLDLGMCLEAALDQFESDLLSRKKNFDPADPDILPKIWKKKVSTEGAIAITPTISQSMLDLINYQKAAAAEFKEKVDKRDKYDIFLERAASLYITQSSAINFISEKFDVDLYTIDDARKLDLDVDPDMLDLAVKSGTIEPDMFDNDEGVENINFDVDVENDYDDTDVI